jgi:hypothetical protein
MSTEQIIISGLTDAEVLLRDQVLDGGGLGRGLTRLFRSKGLEVEVKFVSLLVEEDDDIHRARLGKTPGKYIVVVKRIPDNKVTIFCQKLSI